MEGAGSRWKGLLPPAIADEQSVSANGWKDGGGLDSYPTEGA
jgi:hypothetical protein